MTIMEVAKALQEDPTKVFKDGEDSRITARAYGYYNASLRYEYCGELTHTLTLVHYLSNKWEEVR